MVYVMPGENTGESQNTGSAFITNGHQFAKIYFLDTGYSAYPPARYVEFVPTYGRIPVTRTQIKIKIQELIQELV